MGAACCTAARDKDQSNRLRGDTLHRNDRCSPTWSFHWENRRRVAGEIEDSPYQVPHGFSRDVGVEMKGTLAHDGGTLSDSGSPHGSFGTPMSLKSPIHEVMSMNLMNQPSDLSMESDYPLEVNGESPDIADLSMPKFLCPIPSSFSTPVTGPIPSGSQPLQPNSTPSRRARRSPGRRLLRQISDSRILGFRSPNSCTLSEGRSSFVLSSCSHELVMGSRGGSSDGWSMRTFSELVASSQRERWSFDSEHLGSGFDKVSGCSSRFSYSPSLDMQTCGACSKLLVERSSWSSNELSVVAVLACGHVYHAECLENITPEVDKYDPVCPICMGGEKQISKMSIKASRAIAELKSRSHKISRNRVVDSNLDSDSDDLCFRKNAIQGTPGVEPSSSAAKSFAKPFLRKHFSFGSRWSRTLSENDSARKKGFWARDHKD